MLVVCALTVSLAHWQWQRSLQKAERQAQIDRAAASPPVTLARDAMNPDDLLGLTVQVQGRFVARRTIFIDNRTHRGIAGFHVMTPVTIDGSDLQVMVLRGWVAADPRDRTRLPNVPTPDGLIRLAGTVERDLGRTIELKSSVSPGPGERLWQNFDPVAFERWSGLRLQPFVLRQSAEPPIDDNLVREWRALGSDVDKHRGYAAQWLAMALASLAGALYLAFGRRRGGRTT